ncbi:hypothetical protein Smic_45200 [Streptomyces microflavus]|uniref:Uncharacterized protein n=1 Tax=Streptomyces microflavus TaxID=1919 RepID=A0A7J0CVP4_STRMI|nr:hypothetical protein Smic_45200 [Streptomyces microflavus]
MARAEVEGQHQLGGAAGPGGGAFALRWLPGRFAERQRVALAEGGRAQAREEVGRAAAQHRFRLKAARERQVAAYPAHRGAHVQHRARRNPHGRAPRHGPPVDAHPAPRTADDGHHGPVGADRAPGDGGLQEGGARPVARQPVGQPGGGGVQHPGPPDAEVRPAGAARVLDGGEGAGADDVEDPLPSRTDVNCPPP